MNDQYDVLILGTGIAGLSCALGLVEAGKKVCIVTRESRPKQTNTYWAQGGIIYAPGSHKQKASFVEDILTASSNTANIHAAKYLAEHSAKILEELLLNKARSDFNRNSDGELLFTKEAAHSEARIIYKGDYTGKEIQISLLNYLTKTKHFPNLTFLTSHTGIDLITPSHHGREFHQRYEEDEVIGAYVFDQLSKKVKKIIAKKTVLATGGIGSLYIHNSNSPGSRGDGHAMAKRAGAKVINMEFIQFHPTTFYTGTNQRRFLISEAVRGEGGRLQNSKGEYFMSKYHPDEEMAPRDIVSRSILSELIELKDDCVYLDISMRKESWIKERFPTIYSYCLEHGIDITKQAIPVVPAAHYTCGGVKTNLLGETNLKGLYAVGEVACNGLHGANRLASTSLLEGLTFGHTCALEILKQLHKIRLYDRDRIKEWSLGSGPVDLALVSQDISTIKQTMWNYLGLKRSRNRLARARAMFRELSDEIQKFYRDAELHDELIGLRNAVEVGVMVLNSSLRNQESVGCFYREN